MRSLLLCLTVGVVWAGPVSGISDREIRREVARIQKVAASEPPMMAADTLLHAAELVQPYLPREAEHLHRQVLQLVERHPDLRVSSTMVKHWVRLDPRGAEARILRLKQRRRALEALMAYHQREGNRARSVALAADVIRTARDEAFSERGNLRIVAEARPLEAVELFDLLCREELPALAKIYESFRNRGLEVFAITDETAAAARDFLAMNPAGIPVLLDEKGRVFEHYGVQARPQTIVLDRAGRRTRHFSGPAAEALRPAIESALQLGP